ncbi:MAG: hypothetical protein AAGF12_38190 [Myxococcota bacterium]
MKSFWLAALAVVAMGSSAQAQFTGGPSVPGNICYEPSLSTRTPDATATLNSGIERLMSDDGDYNACGWISEYSGNVGGEEWTITVQDINSVSQEACVSTYLRAHMWAYYAPYDQWYEVFDDSENGTWTTTFGGGCSIGFSGTTPSWASKIRLTGDASHREASYPYLPSQQVAIETSMGWPVVN